jgi:hypothetical protein
MSKDIFLVNNDNFLLGIGVSPKERHNVTIALTLTEICYKVESLNAALHFSIAGLQSTSQYYLQIVRMNAIDDDDDDLHQILVATNYENLKALSKEVMTAIDKVAETYRMVLQFVIHKQTDIKIQDTEPPRKSFVEFKSLNEAYNTLYHTAIAACQNVEALAERQSCIV